MRILFGLVPLLLGGCAQWGEQLYVAHDIKIGLDASVNTATTSGSVDLGYDRRFLTFVPRSVEVDEQGTELAKDGAEAAEAEPNPVSPDTEPSSDSAGATGEGTSMKAREVMSVMACSRLSVSLFQIDYYDESLATGRAAVRFANALAKEHRPVFEDYFDCFRKKDKAQEELERKRAENKASGDAGDGS